jgi:hypothetical protein
MCQVYGNHLPGRKDCPRSVLVAEGMTPAEILKAYPDLEAADIREALRFAAEAVRERELPMLSD